MRATLLLLILIAAPTWAQTTRFPALAGETADGRKVELPILGGRPWTVLGLAYSQKAQPLLEAWYEPAYLRFVAKHGLFAAAHDAEVFFIPLFVGLNKTAYEPSMKKFRKSASPELLDHVVFSKADIEELQRALGMQRKEIPYFFVLDAQGNVVHRSEGAYTDEKLDAIEAVLLQ